LIGLISLQELFLLLQLFLQYRLSQLIVGGFSVWQKKQKQ